MLEMDAELEQYILAHSEPEGEVLAELSRATHLNVLRPRMLSGNLQGQFLKMICPCKFPDNILGICKGSSSK